LSNGVERPLALLILSLTITVVPVWLTLMLPEPGIAKQTEVSLARGTSAYLGVVFSPDGSRVAFSSNRDRSYDIWIMDADGRHQTQLTNLAGDEEYPRFSPDGKSIAFYYVENLNSSILYMRVDGSDLRKLPLFGIAYRNFEWSPDSRSIVCEIEDSWGRNIVVVQIQDRKKPWLTFQADGSFPSWNEKGTRLVFVRAMKGLQELRIAEYSSGSERRVLSSAFEVISPRFFHNDSEIVFLTKYLDSWKLLSVDLRDGTTRDLLQPVGGFIAPSSKPILSRRSIGVRNPHGKEIVFAAYSTESRMNVFALSEDVTVLLRTDLFDVPVAVKGTLLSRLSIHSYRLIDGLSWNSDGTRIVFCASNSTGSHSIVSLIYSEATVRESPYG
jgi:Tol biopolymer transport system component